jgi:hypothetical protein
MTSHMDFSERFRFAHWPNVKIPKIAAGVYAIWNESELIYCGMSGREIESIVRSERATPYGLVTRLASHASGRLSGDQFCVYVANRLVIPRLQHAELSQFADGSLTLDSLTKRYIHQNLVYQYCLVEGSKVAYQLEATARGGEIFGQKPFLNPA